MTLNLNKKDLKKIDCIIEHFVGNKEGETTSRLLFIDINRWKERIKINIGDYKNDSKLK